MGLLKSTTLPIKIGNFVMFNIEKPITLTILPITLSHQSYIIESISSWLSTPDYDHTIPANKARELIAAIYGYKNKIAFKNSSTETVDRDRNLELKEPELSTTEIYLNIYHQIQKISNGKYNGVLCFILADYFKGLFEGRWDDLIIIDGPSLLLINMIDRFPHASDWGSEPCKLFFTLNNVGHFMTTSSYCRTVETDKHMDMLNDLANNGDSFLKAVEHHGERYEHLKFPKIHKTYNYILSKDGINTNNNLANKELKPLLRLQSQKIGNKKEFIQQYILQLPFFATQSDDNKLSEQFKSLSFLETAKIKNIKIQSNYVNSAFDFLSKNEIENLDSKFHFDENGLVSLIFNENQRISLIGTVDLAEFGQCNFELFFIINYFVQHNFSPKLQSLISRKEIPNQKPRKILNRLTIFNDKGVLYSNTPENKLQSFPYGSLNLGSNAQGLGLELKKIIDMLILRTNTDIEKNQSVFINLGNSISEQYLRKKINFSSSLRAANKGFALRHEMPSAIKEILTEVSEKELSQKKLPSLQYFPDAYTKKGKQVTWQEFHRHITLLYTLKFTLNKNDHEYIIGGPRYSYTLQEVFKYVTDRDRYIPIKEYSLKELQQFNKFLNAVIGTDIVIKKTNLDGHNGLIELIPIPDSKLNSKARKYKSSMKKQLAFS